MRFENWKSSSLQITITNIDSATWGGWTTTFLFCRFSGCVLCWFGDHIIKLGGSTEQFGTFKVMFVSRSQGNRVCFICSFCECSSSMLFVLFIFISLFCFWKFTRIILEAKKWSENEKEFKKKCILAILWDNSISMGKKGNRTRTNEKMNEHETLKKWKNMNKKEVNIKNETTWTHDSLIWAQSVAARFFVTLNVQKYPISRPWWDHETSNKIKGMRRFDQAPGVNEAW